MNEGQRHWLHRKAHKSVVSYDGVGSGRDAFAPWCWCYIPCFACLPHCRMPHDLSASLSLVPPPSAPLCSQCQHGADECAGNAWEACLVIFASCCACATPRGKQALQSESQSLPSARATTVSHHLRTCWKTDNCKRQDSALPSSTYAFTIQAPMHSQYAVAQHRRTIRIHSIRAHGAAL